MGGMFSPELRSFLSKCKRWRSKKKTETRPQGRRETPPKGSNHPHSRVTRTDRTRPGQGEAGVQETGDRVNQRGEVPGKAGT